MNCDLYKFGDKVKIVGVNYKYTGRIGTFINVHLGHPRVHIYPEQYIENSMLWEHVYSFNWDDISKCVGQLLFNFMY